MNKKLSVTQMASVSLMLFAMFFGAGNMIFPPMVGNLAGTAYIKGILGFTATDAGLAIAGITAIVLCGRNLKDLGNLIGPKFSVLLGLTVYLLIGPLFALPRTGTVSYAIGIKPFTGDTLVSSVIFTFIFFAVTYILCLNPSKVVDIVGKVLTPVLLIAIFCIFVMSLLHSGGNIAAPQGEYADIPFFKGFIEGYLSLDGLAALAFAIVVIKAIEGMGVEKPGEIVKYTVFCGIFASIALGIVYLALGYVGATAQGGQIYDDGGVLLTDVVGNLMGTTGKVVLGIAVLLACLTTSIGLSTSFSDYIVELKPNWSYKKVLAVVIGFSFVISNIGLSRMIAITLPALIAVYPPVMAMVLFSFFKNIIGENRESYVLAVLFSSVVGILDALKAVGMLSEETIDFLSNYLPFFELGIGWIVPACAGVLIGLLPFVNFMKKNQVA